MAAAAGGHLGLLLRLMNMCNIKGLRFSPTEVELMEYLAEFVRGRASGLESVDNRCIPAVNLNAHEPRDIPALCQTEFPGEKTEYYLFHRSTRKYPTSNREDRSTNEGYWKATGRPTLVKDKNQQVIGERKTLVFYNGRAVHKGTQNEGKTDWIMHEFRPSGIATIPGEATWVVCSISYKPMPPPTSPSESQRILSPGPASPISSSTSAVSGGGSGRGLKNKSPPGSELPSPKSVSSLGGGDHNYLLEHEDVQLSKAPRTEMGKRPSLIRSEAFVVREPAPAAAGYGRSEALVQDWMSGAVPDAGYDVLEGTQNWNPAEVGQASAPAAGGLMHNSSPESSSRSPAFFPSLTFNEWRAGGDNMAARYNFPPALDVDLDAGDHPDCFLTQDDGLLPLWNWTPGDIEGPANSGS